MSIQGGTQGLSTQAVSTCGLSTGEKDEYWWVSIWGWVPRGGEYLGWVGTQQLLLASSGSNQNMYGWQADGTHPTGILSCNIYKVNVECTNSWNHRITGNCSPPMLNEANNSDRRTRLITALQPSCGKVMFSVLSVCVSVSHSVTGGVPLQGLGPEPLDLFKLIQLEPHCVGCPNSTQHTHIYTHTPIHPYTHSNLFNLTVQRPPPLCPLDTFKLVHYMTHVLLESGRLAFDWDVFLS